MIMIQIKLCQKMSTDRSPIDPSKRKRTREIDDENEDYPVVPKLKLSVNASFYGFHHGSILDRSKKYPKFGNYSRNLYDNR